MLSLPLKGTVQDIRDGVHGQYAVATVDEKEIGGSVTFSLQPKVWKASRLPRPGEKVYLGALTEKSAGWRSEHARHWTVTDEKLGTAALAQELLPNWAGYLTLENAPQVKEAIHRFFGGRRLTFVTETRLSFDDCDMAMVTRRLLDGSYPMPMLNVYTGQQLDWLDGEPALRLHLGENHAHIVIPLTSCSTGFSTNLRSRERPVDHDPQDLVYLTFEWSQLRVEHRAPGGNKLVWVYALEREQNDQQ